MSDYMGDLSSILNLTQSASAVTATHTANPRAGKDLELNDFLQLMVATFQNQSIDDTASISDMMNQMVQMSVVQAITNISSLVTESTNLSYAASLVGKEVTLSRYQDGEPIRGTVTGTGTLNGQQVIFVGNDSYWLSEVLAVGRLPENEADINPDAQQGGEA